MHLLIFGSSITWGAWDAEGGWAQRIKSFCDKKAIANDLENYTTVYCLGVSGNNTVDLLERFDSEVKARLNEQEKTVIVTEIGINDSQFSLIDKNHRVSPQEYRENLQKLIEKSKKFGAEILFLGLTPVDERVDPIPWKPDFAYRIEFVKKYEETLKEVCQKENVPFIEIMSQFDEKEYKTLLIDGLHPTTQGHKIMFEKVKNYLLEKKTI